MAGPLWPAWTVGAPLWLEARPAPNCTSLDTGIEEAESLRLCKSWGNASPEAQLINQHPAGPAGPPSPVLVQPQKPRSTSQGEKVSTRVYTPGLKGRAQPAPQLTMPTRISPLALRLL